VDFLRTRRRRGNAAAGDVLVRRSRDERGLAFWAILEGTVEVRLTGETACTCR
jgi:hypothetical protein